METVRTYQNFLDRLKSKYGYKEKIVCLLFVDPFNDDVMGRYITHRFDYLHERTGQYVDFFCPGYNEESGNGREFNVKDFVEFVNHFEMITNWRYLGGTNLLLIRYEDSELHFDSVYDLNFGRMIIDGMIRDHRHFIEDIIYAFRSDIECYMGEQGMKRHIGSIWNNFSELLPRFARKILRQITDTGKIHRHFSPHDISK